MGTNDQAYERIIPPSLPSFAQLGCLPLHEDSGLHLDVAPIDELAEPIGRERLKDHGFHRGNGPALRVVLSLRDFGQ
jgi:hypothetical protein